MTRHLHLVARQQSTFPRAALRAQAGWRRRRRSRGETRAASTDVAARQPALLQVLLVVILRLVECRRGCDLSHDGPAIAAAVLALLLRGDRKFLLRVIVIEDR